MDETRDIAIRADEASKSAHRRLNGYNGQIARLAQAVEATNEKLDDVVNNPTTGLRAELSNLRTDVKVGAAKLAIMLALVATVFGAGASAIASHFLSQHPTPQPSQTATSSR